MKRLLVTLVLGVALGLPALAAEPAEPAEESGASALIIDALRGLSALLPKPEAPAQENAAVSTIGIRGNESTTTLITPYWKDDRSDDPAFAAQLSAYAAAQRLLEEQRWEEAHQSLTAFLTEHPGSDLTPNARFGQALAAAGAQRSDEAARQFRQFASDYPTHPLRGEAERIAAALDAAK